MPSLGDFEAAALELDPTVESTTFGWCGETIRLLDDVGVYPLMRFAADLDGVSSPLRAWAVQFAFLKALIVPDDWPVFEETCLSHRVTDEMLTELVKAVISGATGRPTRRPSGSPDGPPSTTESSRDDSVSRPQGGSLVGFESMPSVDDLIAERVFDSSALQPAPV